MGNLRVLATTVHAFHENDVLRFEAYGTGKKKMKLLISSTDYSEWNPLKVNGGSESSPTH